MIFLVKEHGVQYLLAATILTGILQIIAGSLKLTVLLKLVSQPVMTGVVNALAILVFLEQIPELAYGGVAMVEMVLLGLAIIYLFPYLTKAIPSPLVCIAVLTALSCYTNLGLRNIADMGVLPTTFPVFLWPEVPLNLATLKIIFPYSAAMATVGLLVSLMTATIVDDITNTTSNKVRECCSQGIANIVAGLFGGMAGCGMIGQSVINIKTGGRGRLSTLFAGVFLLGLIVLMGDWIKNIPMAALVAIMIMVAINTFRWSSLKDLTTHPKTSSFITISTVAVVLLTHDLVKGVLLGVAMNILFFIRSVAQINIQSEIMSDDTTTEIYRVQGHLFFASVDQFIQAFRPQPTINRIIIDLSEAHFWDLCAVRVLDKLILKFRQQSVSIELLGLNQASATIIKQLALHNQPNALKKIMPYAH
jgi:SulP family sulfate permease